MSTADEAKSFLRDARSTGNPAFFAGCETVIDSLAVKLTAMTAERDAALASPPPQATGAREWEARMSSDGKRVVLDSADFKHDAALILNGDFESPDQRMNYARGLAAKLNALSSAKREAEPLTPDQANNVWRRWIAAGHVQCDWLSLLRLTEAAHGITAASQVEPEDK